MSDRSARPPATQLSLFGESQAAVSTRPVVVLTDPDADARGFAVDPSNNVVLEASAGTGKTSVLVQRYLNLLRAGIDPRVGHRELRARGTSEWRQAVNLTADLRGFPDGGR